MDEPTPPRQPSDTTSRRLDRMEVKYDALATEVSSLTGTVERMSTNQAHAAELNQLRFAALDLAVNGIGAKLDNFMVRIEGIISGDVQTEQVRQGRETLQDYKNWRAQVERDRDEQVVLNTQIRSYGRLAAWLIGGNVVGLAVGVLALIQASN